MQQLPAELGRYRVDCELGRGGMGVVYRGFDPVVERPVAIKAIRYGGEFGPQPVERLRREAKAIGSLEHPNIVTLFDAGEAEGTFYLVMQLVNGETLRQRMDRKARFRIGEALDVFGQLLAALDYAHTRGIVHRDVKPGNVLIAADGVVKLADFGVARLAGPGLSTKGQVLGTPSYMAPEQINGAPVDARADIFAAGCILYELLVGRKAFGGSSATAVMCQILHENPRMPRAIVPGIPAALEAVILKALAKDPAERFGSCAELRSALEACPGEEPAAEHPTTLFRARSGSRAAAMARVLLTAVLVLPALVVAPARNGRRDVPRREPAAAPPVQAALPQPAPSVREPAAVPPFRGAPRHREARAGKGAGAFLSRPAARREPPESFSSELVKGDVAFQRDQYKEALEFYKLALRLKPGDAAVRKKIAVTLTLLGRPEGARQYQ